MPCARSCCDIIFNESIGVVNAEAKSIVADRGRLHVIDCVVIKIDAPIPARYRDARGGFTTGRVVHVVNEIIPQVTSV